MGFPEGDLAIDQLRRSGHDEQGVAVLLELRVLVRLAGILDGERVKVELSLDAVKEARG